MNDLEFAALLVSRVCHDLVSPVSAVMNGLEVLEDERDAAMRADALKLVTSSAEQAAARLQFARIAFGAAGSAGAQLDLNEVGRMTKGLLKGGKVEMEWGAASLNWPKDWAKLLMNAALMAADSLPRGGKVQVHTSNDPSAPSFTVRATGPGARVLEEVEKAARGEPNGPVDGRSIQPFLTHKLARSLNAGLTLTFRDNEVELAAG
ncbi:MAG: histidine phosphotransferase [Alphaproteobacteria bacterium]|nr:histidine phosphotransferase [Alphaproteobacteria bacterium]MBV9063636.1 histidine phosphotransferase [Alphaproteobacteria bacterium]